MKKFKFLKMLFLTVGMTAVFSAVNSFAMERNNSSDDGITGPPEVLYSSGPLYSSGKQLPLACSKEFPKLVDVLEENEQYEFDDIQGNPAEDLNYKYSIDGEKKLYYFDNSLKYVKNKGDNFYYKVGHNNSKCEELPIADTSANYKVIEKDNKIYYIVNDNSLSGGSQPNLVCYEAQIYGDKIWYLLNGKERFFTVRGENKYYVPIRGNRFGYFFSVRRWLILPRGLRKKTNQT